MRLRNPILSGCYPDPSICRVDDDYFLVTSSFAMHPGLPLHRSRDLQTWEPIGHVLAGDSWIGLDGFDSSDGIWAPTIRHHRGLFYVVFTLARGRTGVATYVCTASDPAGHWTLDEVKGAEGIDPSLFFDEDGTCWFSAARDAIDPAAYGPGEIWVQQFDAASRTLVGRRRAVWHGALTRTWVEAPHIYREGNRYHLIAAEGGTEYHHAITAASAAHPLGPYTTDPRSPLLTHRHLGHGSPIENVGHGDVVRAPDGTPWGVVLGVRPVEGFHTLGRETFLVPMEWDEDGPVFAPGTGTVTLGPVSEPDPRSPAWVSLRGPVDAEFLPDCVALAPSAVTLADAGVPGFLAVRQSEHAFEFAATVEMPRGEGQRVGIFAFQNERHHIGVVAEQSGDTTVVRVVAVDGDSESVLAEASSSESVRMRIVAAPTSYRFEAFSAAMSPGGMAGISTTVPHSALSTELAGGFVGVLLGLFHQGPPDVEPARFRDVDHRAGSAGPPLHPE